MDIIILYFHFFTLNDPRLSQSESKEWE